MPPSALTQNYDALLSTTLFNYRKTLEDNISKTNAILWKLKQSEMGYKLVDDIGERMAMPLMYEIGQADSYAGYDVLDTSPMDGMTMAFYEWRQAAVPIAISGVEEKKNQGQAKIISLLEGKTKQAEMGIQEFFGEKLLIGAGGTTLTTAYASPVNGSTFVDPLPKLVHYTPSTSLAVGNINQSTYSWWRNGFTNSGGATYAAWLKEMRLARMAANRGPGGSPDFHISDENVYALYETALADKHRNTSYTKADIPFENIMFYGSPLVYDERVPDVATGSATVLNTSGTWYMLNTKFLQVQVHSGTNFTPTPFVKPENQDAKVSQILWLGGFGCSNRRKQHVVGSIDTTITS